MEIVFLGTGTSQGVPMIAHNSEGCDLADPRNWRTRSSIHVVMDGYHVQVDASPEFRLQCLRNAITWIDTFILTHRHADHIMGMDDLRRFCDQRDYGALDVYSTEEGLQRVREIYAYAICDVPAQRGYAAFRLHPMPELLAVPGGKIYSTLLPHGSILTLGLIFEEASSGKKAAYFSDCKEIPSEARALAEGAELVVLDGLRPHPHPTHMSIHEAIEVAEQMQPPRTLLTHLTYQIDHATWSKELPEGIELAYDGLRVVL